MYEFQEEGLTLSGNKRFLNNPQGHGLWLREKGQFCGDPLKKRLRMYYTFYCDFSASKICTMRQAAEYVGSPLVLIWIAAVLHKMRSLQKLFFKRSLPEASAGSDRG